MTDGRILLATTAAVGTTLWLAAGNRGLDVLVVAVAAVVLSGSGLRGFVAHDPSERAGKASRDEASDRSTTPYAWMVLAATLLLGIPGVAVAHPRWTLMLAVWTSCCGLAIAAAWLIDRARRASDFGPHSRLDLEEGAAVLVLVGIALLFRTHALDALPPGVWVDEANAAQDALRILEGRFVSPFGLGWYDTPNLYIYFMAAVFAMLGVSVTALKAISLIPALLTVPAQYVCSRVVFGPRVAIVATLLLAVSHWHAIISRWGWNELFPPLVQLVAVALLVAALRHRRTLWFVLSGLTLGLGLYTYLAARLVVASVVVYLGARAAVERGFFLHHRRNLAVMGLSFLLACAPLVATYTEHPEAIGRRTGEISILRDVEVAGSWQPVLTSSWRHLLMFHVEGDRNARHNLPGKPMVDPLTGALLILGTGALLARPRDHRTWLIFSWLLLGLLGGVLSRLEEAPQGYRTLTVLPALCLLAGVAADALLRACRHRRAWATGLVGALVVAAAATWIALFSWYGNETRVWLSFNPVQNAVGRWVARHRSRSQPTDQIYLESDLYYFSTIRFLNYAPPSHGSGGIDDPPFALLPEDPGSLGGLSWDGRIAFILEPRSTERSRQLRAAFPMLDETLHSERGHPLFILLKGQPDVAAPSPQGHAP